MLAESINWDYILERLNRYNANPSDDLLYRIGTHSNVLTIEDCSQIDGSLNGALSPEQRYRVLNWILCNSFEIEGDLALLIFGRKQLEEWLERSHQAYPNFEFYLCFEYQEKFRSGWDDGINFTMHWHPQPGAPMPLPETETDFPSRPFWDDAELFWGDYPGGATNDFDFTLYCHPNEASFTKPGWVCEEGDWYTMKSEREADLMSVAQVLQHFAV